MGQMANGTAPRAGGRRWWRVALSLTPVLGLLGLLVYGFTREPRVIPSPLVGKPAPDFQLTLFDGSQVRLSDFGSKVAIDYGVYGLPETFLISSDGLITYKHIGAIEADLLAMKMEEALRGAVSAEGRGADYRSIR